MASKNDVELKTNSVEEKIPYDKTRKLFQTTYKGVYFGWVQRKGSSQLQKSFVIRWMRAGKPHTEWVGTQHEDDMTPARANNIRSSYIEGTKTCKAEKKKAAIQEKAKANHGTFDNIYQHYENNYERLRQKKRGVKSFRSDELRYKIYISPKFGTRVPSSVSTEELDDFKAELKNTKKRRGNKDEYLSEGTIWQILEIIRRLQMHAIKKMGLDGFASPYSPKKPTTRKMYLLKEIQIRNLVKACQDYHDRQTANAVLILLLTGARKGEILGLRQSDVDEEYGRLHFRETKIGTEDNIPLSPDVAEILKNHITVEGSEWVFVHPNGERLKEIWWGAKTIFKNAGLPPTFRIHDLRHTFISKMLSKGVPLKTVMEIVRHKNIATTMQYMDADEDAQREAMNKAGDIFLNSEGRNSLSETPIEAESDYQI